MGGWFPARWFAPFEGDRNPYPLAIFRIALFAGLALHFFPSLIWLDDHYAHGSLRSAEWSHWLYLRFHRVPEGWLRVLSITTMIGCSMALVGLLPRAGALVAGVGFYAFASFNGLPVQTLALITAWGLLVLWILCGGGSAVLSVDAWLRRLRGRGPPGRPREPALLPALALFQILLAVFFAGIEKLIAGWPFSNEMGVVLSYPRGFMVRDWVASAGWLHGEAVSTALSWFTVLVELGTPILLLFRRTRIPALIAYELFFLGIIAMMEVPPLFWLMFAAGGLLVLDDADIERIRGLLRRALRRPAPAPADPAGGSPPPAPSRTRGRPGRGRGGRRR